MDSVIHIDFDEVEHFGSVPKEDRKANRILALKLLDRLIEHYGRIEKVPESDRDLHQVRLFLGAYEEAFVNTDVIDLRNRVQGLATKLGVRQMDILELIAAETEMTARTIKSKIYKNAFKVAEKRAVSVELVYLEQISGVSYIEECSEETYYK